jgi:hypothetical protein
MGTNAWLLYLTTSGSAVFRKARQISTYLSGCKAAAAFRQSVLQKSADLVDAGQQHISR